MRNGDDTSADEIRVVIAEMPKLLAAVVCKAVETERDMTIVAQVEAPDALKAAMSRDPDVIVTAARGADLTPEFRAALFARPAIPVVAISPDGNSIDVYGRWAMHGSGLAGLTALIREAAAGARLRFGS